MCNFGLMSIIVIRTSTEWKKTGMQVRILWQEPCNHSTQQGKPKPKKSCATAKAWQSLWCKGNSVAIRPMCLEKGQVQQSQTMSSHLISTNHNHVLHLGTQTSFRLCSTAVRKENYKTYQHAKLQAEKTYAVSKICCFALLSCCSLAPRPLLESFPFSSCQQSSRMSVLGRRHRSASAFVLNHVK